LESARFHGGMLIGRGMGHQNAGGRRGRGSVASR
jgi:hypothetical protein